MKLNRLQAGRFNKKTQLAGIFESNQGQHHSIIASTAWQPDIYPDSVTEIAALRSQ
jgi:hypothetical protein